MRAGSRLATLATFLATSCATSSLKLAPEAPDRPWSPVSTASGAIKPGAPPSHDLHPGYGLPPNPALAALPDVHALDPTHTYGLDELIDFAQSNNPATRIAWDEAKSAALAVGIVRSSYLPRLSATALGAYQTSRGSTNVGSMDGGDSGRNVRGEVATASLQWLLFDFGRRKALVRSAQQTSILSNIAFDAVHQRIVESVSIAYYDDAAAVAAAADAGTGLRDAAIVRSAVEGRMAHGQATIVEVARARQAEAQANLAKVQADGERSASRIRLLTAMGASPFAQLTLAPVVVQDLPPVDEVGMQDSIRNALSRRPDMLSAYARVLASGEEAKAAKADFLPKVFLSATGSYNHGSVDITSVPGNGSIENTPNVTSSNRSATVLLGVSVPIYDGGVRDARLRQAREAQDRAAASLTQTRDQAVTEIVTTRIALATAIAAHQAARTLLSASQTSFDAALGSYRSGVGTMTDLATAEANLSSARTLYTTSYTDALAAAARLAIRLGA